MTKGKAKRLLIWIAVNGALSFALYLALFQGNETAKNIIKFVLWANFAIWLLVLLAGSEMHKKCKDKGISIGVVPNCIYGLVWSLLLAAHGWFLYAALEFATTYIQAAVFGGEDTVVEDKTEEQGIT